MKLEDYISLSGIEISNGNRTREYLNSGLLTGVSIVSSSCGCDSTDEGPYVSPADDPAPWYDPARVESSEFLGLLAADVRLDAVAIRTVTPRFSVGSTIGSLYLKHRIVSVRGLLLAQTAQGMSYGERWLSSILAGTTIGCAPNTIRILLSCPTGYDATPQFRTLRRVGIVDGPTPGPAQELPECYIQEVSFQIAAGIPWLMSDEIVCMAETVVT